MVLVGGCGNNDRPAPPCSLLHPSWQAFYITARYISSVEANTQRVKIYVSHWQRHQPSENSSWISTHCSAFALAISRSSTQRRRLHTRNSGSLGEWLRHRGMSHGGKQTHFRPQMHPQELHGGFSMTHPNGEHCSFQFGELVTHDVKSTVPPPRQ
jgi:hypothetical protein